MRRGGAIAILMAGLVGTSISISISMDARASDAPPITTTVPPATTTIVTRLRPDANPGYWKDEWPRFSIWEGALTFAATVGVYVAERRVPEPESPNIVFEVPVVDPTVRWML